MKIFYKIILVVLAAIYSESLSAQRWVEMMEDPNTNFYDLKAEFENYWKDRPMEKGKGYKQFKRYEYYAEPRVYPSGDRSLASRSKAYEEFQKYIEENPGAQSFSRSATWQPMGPNGAPTGGGAGRNNFVRFHPTETQTYWVGTPAGGLWKTINNGVSWTTNTDQLSVIGCSDLAIDPTNANIMYLATGDNDAGDTFSIGILKSTDGGNTWSPTGLTWTVNQSRRIAKILINPNNTQVIVAATSAGIFRTTNGGTSWTQITGANHNFKDMEQKPGDFNTLYAAGTRLFRSTDGGATWTQITAGLPASNTVSRLAIGVTAADPAYVYVLAGATNNGFLGVYRSTDSGLNYTARSTTPNLLGWDTNGGDSGGQAWFDLAIAISPTNKDNVFVGGVNIWRSTNGGTSWTLNAHWYGGGGKPYVHADHHDLFFVGSTLYSANDGGLFRTTNNGTSWSDISANMQIAQIYRLGMSTSNANLLLTGHQDNGTNRLNGTSWSEVLGGDGMECFIDRTNNNIMYGSSYYGNFSRSTNGGSSWTGISSSLPEGNWVTPWVQDPTVANTLYACFNQIYKSTDRGTNWTAIGPTAGANFVAIAVAPSNNQVIYAARSNSMFKTTNGGTSWTAINSGLPSGNRITYIAIAQSDPNKVWVTYSGYTAGSKIFFTSNGGTSWSNYSTGLPNLPTNCVVYQNDSYDGVYVGTDVGVYYRDATMTSWMLYSAGLPNTIVNELEIYYPTSKLRAATYGRGVWESDLYFASGSPAPIINFTSNVTNICIGATVNFTDQSQFSPTTWSWSFPGGTPATSILQNPSVVYATAGNYAVTLTATNDNGSNTQTINSYIRVFNPPTVSLSPSQPSFCPGIGVTLSASGATTYTWSPPAGLSATTGSTVRATPAQTTVYTVTGSANGCSTTSTISVSPHTVVKPTINYDGTLLTSTSGPTYTWFFNSFTIPGGDQQFITPNYSGEYFVTVTDANGCVQTSDAIEITFTGIENAAKSSSFTLKPNPNNGVFDITFERTGSGQALLEIRDMLGRSVLKENLQKNSGTLSKSFDLTGKGKGVYFISLTDEAGEQIKKMVIY
jgi:PKD repeat protein